MTVVMLYSEVMQARSCRSKFCPLVVRPTVRRMYCDIPTLYDRTVSRFLTSTVVSGGRHFNLKFCPNILSSKKSTLYVCILSIRLNDVKKEENEHGSEISFLF